VTAAELRELLRNWGVYGPLNPEGTAFGWKAIPVDELSDEAIFEIADQIGRGGGGTRTDARQPRPT